MNRVPTELEISHLLDEGYVVLIEESKDGGIKVQVMLADKAETSSSSSSDGSSSSSDGGNTDTSDGDDGAIE
jgi:hypothetical protein